MRPISNILTPMLMKLLLLVKLLITRKCISSTYLLCLVQNSGGYALCKIAVDVCIQKLSSTYPKALTYLITHTPFQKQ